MKKIENKVISISGTNNKLKIKFLLLLIKKNKKNILIINMDYFIEELLIKNINKINRKIDFINCKEIIQKNKNIKEYINNLKNKFELIIINTSYECFFDYNKKLIKNSNKNYFLISNDLIEIKKASYLLKMYKNNWKISNKKIKIIVN